MSFDAELYEVMQNKYLNYAISVISDRALPDIRDGLKPVQRRIIYAMYHELKLYATSKHRKCAAIVGAVLGKYHPHGDTAAYEALVRLAQDFNMRYPLVEGAGNFGSIDGDNAAAMRYTEARLTPLAEELIDEIKDKTVNYRPNYDGTCEEPLVLPSKWPQLLCNGTSGIAVGMATSIPPHNLTEVLEAAIYFVDNREAAVKDLMQFIKGPDFPSGTKIINTKKELEDIYTNGSGSVIMRGEYKTEDVGRGKVNIIITSIPYQVNRTTLIEQIAELIQNKKVPQLQDVANESDAQTRIVLEVRSKEDIDLVMNYLYKNTSLQSSFKVNLTTLIPGEADTLKPIKANLADMLSHYVDHRFDVLKRKYEFELKQLLKRIHILEGFEAVYLDLDKAIKIIRSSKGKEDAADNLMKEFPLDKEQADAILETKLYNLARLEMMKIKDELKSKRALAKDLEKKLGSDQLMWKDVQGGFKEMLTKFGDKRRCVVATKTDAVIELDKDAYIQHEDNDVIVTNEGWIKRMKEVKSVSTLRVREGDSIVSVLRANTRDTLLVLTNKGMLYSLQVNDLQYTPGFGEPIQKLLKFSDGEKIISLFLSSENKTEQEKTLLRDNAGEKEFIPVLFVTSGGMGYRYLIAKNEQTTKKGKKCIKLVDKDVVIAAYFISTKNMFIASYKGKGAEYKINELPTLSSPGKGVKLMKLEADDYLVAAALMDDKTKVSLINSNDNDIKCKQGEFKIASRTHAAKQILKRGRLTGLRETPVWAGFEIPSEIQ